MGVAGCGAFRVVEECDGFGGGAHFGGGGEMASCLGEATEGVNGGRLGCVLRE